ncbi:MAG: hypothetical protein IT423_09775, partial [Pirellulaceae bacterium]|nr:hypothetical protein [Pirellulaceae bacterium]
ANRKNSSKSSSPASGLLSQELLQSQVNLEQVLNRQGVQLTQVDQHVEQVNRHVVEQFSQQERSLQSVSQQLSEHIDHQLSEQLTRHFNEQKSDYRLASQHALQHSAQLDQVQQHAGEVVERMAAVDRLLAIGNVQQQSAQRTEQATAEIVSLQRELLTLTGQLQTQISQPAPRGEDASQWQLGIQRQLSELQASLSALEDIKACLQNAVAQNQELQGDLQLQRQAIDELARRPLPTPPSCEAISQAVGEVVNQVGDVVGQAVIERIAETIRAQMGDQFSTELAADLASQIAVQLSQSTAQPKIEAQLSPAVGPDFAHQLADELSASLNGSLSSLNGTLNESLNASLNASVRQTIVEAFQSAMENMAVVSQPNTTERTAFEGSVPQNIASVATPSVVMIAPGMLPAVVSEPAQSEYYNPEAVGNVSPYRTAERSHARAVEAFPSEEPYASDTYLPPMNIQAPGYDSTGIYVEHAPVNLNTRELDASSPEPSVAQYAAEQYAAEQYAAEQYAPEQYAAEDDHTQPEQYASGYADPYADQRYAESDVDALPLNSSSELSMGGQDSATSEPEWSVPGFGQSAPELQSAPDIDDQFDEPSAALPPAASNVELPGWWSEDSVQHQAVPHQGDSDGIEASRFEASRFEASTDVGSATSPAKNYFERNYFQSGLEKDEAELNDSTSSEFGAVADDASYPRADEYAVSAFSEAQLAIEPIESRFPGDAIEPEFHDRESVETPSHDDVLNQREFNAASDQYDPLAAFRSAEFDSAYRPANLEPADIGYGDVELPGGAVLPTEFDEPAYPGAGYELGALDVQEEAIPQSLTQTVHASESPTVSASTASPTTGNGDEGGDESVEDYMRRLLARMRGVSESEVSLPASDKNPAAAQVTAKDPSNVQSADPSVDGTTGDGMTEAWTEPFDPEKYVPRGSAPEKNRDLNALRELANNSARSAIQVSARRRQGSAILIKSAVALVGVVAGIALVSINGARINIAFIATVASFLVALIWGYDAIATLRPLLQASHAPKASKKPVEKRADKLKDAPETAE